MGIKRGFFILKFYSSKPYV